MNVPEKMWVVSKRLPRYWHDDLWKESYFPVEITFSEERAKTLAFLYGIAADGKPAAFITLCPVRDLGYFNKMLDPYADACFLFFSGP